MNINRLWWTRVLRAPEDETGGGDTSTAAATTTEATTEATTTDATTVDATTTAATDTATTETAAASTAKWWEDAKRFDGDTQKFLAVKGLTVDDPVEGMAKLAKIARHSEQRLGKPADQLMDRPAKDQSIAEYIKANPDVFGIPENAEGYKIEPPENWPKDAPWDTKLEGKAREVGLELGLNSEQLQGLTNMMADMRLSEMQEDKESLEQITQKLEGDLRKDWGDQYQAKIEQSKQAFAVVAEAAGLDDAAQLAASQVLAEKGGDPMVIKLFAAIGDMMGDDFAAGLGSGGGGGRIGTTPAEARQELEAMMAPESDYMKAMDKMRKSGQRGDYDRLNERYHHLNKIAAQGK